MSVVYVNEYQPSSATLKLGDPIYTASKEKEKIQVGKLAPSPISYLIPLIVVGSVGLVLYWLVK